VKVLRELKCYAISMYYFCDYYGIYLLNIENSKAYFMRLNRKVGGGGRKKKNRNKTLHSACAGILSVPLALIPLKGSVSQEVNFYCQHSPGSLALWFSTGVVRGRHGVKTRECKVEILSPAFLGALAVFL